MTRAQMLQKVTELQQQSQVNQQQYSGHLSLYTAACMAGDTKVADEHRAKALACIEKMLDDLGASATLTRQMQNTRW